MIDSFRRWGLTRASSGAWVGGVLAGLAQRFGVSAGALRLAFLISMILPGPQFLAYLALWILMPRAR